LFNVVEIGTLGKLVSSACYGKQQVCVYLQPFSRYRRANSGKITTFLTPPFEGNLLTQRYEIWSQEIRD